MCNILTNSMFPKSGNCSNTAGTPSVVPEVTQCRSFWLLRNSFFSLATSCSASSLCSSAAIAVWHSSHKRLLSVNNVTCHLHSSRHAYYWATINTVQPFSQFVNHTQKKGALFIIGTECTFTTTNMYQIWIFCLTYCSLDLSSHACQCCFITLFCAKTTEHITCHFDKSTTNITWFLTYMPNSGGSKGGSAPSVKSLALVPQSIKWSTETALGCSSQARTMHSSVSWACCSFQLMSINNVIWLNTVK